MNSLDSERFLIVHVSSSTSLISKFYNHSMQKTKRFLARKTVQKSLEDLGLYLKTEDNEMVIPVCRSVFSDYYVILFILQLEEE